MKKSKYFYLDEKRNLIERLQHLDRNIIDLVERLKEIKASIEEKERDIDQIKRESKEHRELQKREKGVEEEKQDVKEDENRKQSRESEEDSFEKKIQELQKQLSELKTQKEEIINKLKKARQDLESELSRAKGMLDSYYNEAQKGKSNIEHLEASGFKWQHRAAAKEWHDYGSFFCGLWEELETTITSLKFETSWKEVEEDIESNSSGFLAVLGGLLGVVAGGGIGGIPGALAGGLLGAAAGGILESIGKNTIQRERIRELSEYFSAEYVSQKSRYVGIGICGGGRFSDITPGLGTGNSYQPLREKLYSPPPKGTFGISAIDSGPVSNDSRTWIPDKAPSGPISISSESQAQYRRWLSNHSPYLGGSSVSAMRGPLPQSMFQGGSAGIRF